MTNQLLSLGLLFTVCFMMFLDSALAATTVAAPTAEVEFEAEETTTQSTTTTSTTTTKKPTTPAAPRHQPHNQHRYNYHPNQPHRNYPNWSRQPKPHKKPVGNQAFNFQQQYNQGHSNQNRAAVYRNRNANQVYPRQQLPQQHFQKPQQPQQQMYQQWNFPANQQQQKQRQQAVPNPAYQHTQQVQQKPQPQQQQQQQNVRAVGNQCPTYKYSITEDKVEFHTVPGSCKIVVQYPKPRSYGRYYWQIGPPRVQYMAKLS